MFTALLAGVSAVHDEAGSCYNENGTGPTMCAYLTFTGVCSKNSLRYSLSRFYMKLLNMLASSTSLKNRF